MSFDLVHIWSAMGPLSKMIALSLLLMGVASVAVFVERSFTLSRSARASRVLARAVAAPLEDGQLAEVVALCAAHRGAALGRLLGATVQRYLRALDRGDAPHEALEKARTEAERRKELVSTGLRAGMAVVATVGSIAPFVGLLGTVIGIISAFQGIAASGSGGLGAVSVGIAEALVETALGLLIAIPAVIFFNALTQRVSREEQALVRRAAELLEGLGRARVSSPPDFDDETVVVGRPASQALQNATFAAV